MAIGFGYAGWLAYGQESSFGVPPAGTNEVQALTPDHAPSAGHITVSNFGITTGFINATDNQAAVQAAFDAAFGAGNSTISGSLATAIQITWKGIYGSNNVPQVTVPVNTLSGGSYTTLTPSTTTPGVQPTLVYSEIMDEAIELKQTRTPKPVLGTTSESHSVKSKSDVSGNFKKQMQFNDIERLLYNAFGAVATTTHAGESAVYDHTFTRTDALPGSLTFWVDRDSTDIGYQFQYTGCQIDKLTIEQDVDDMLMITPEIIGNGQETLVWPIAKPSAHAFNQIDWLMVNQSGVSASYVTVNSVQIPIKKIKLTLDNKLNKDRYLLGSNLRNGIQRNGVVEVTGTLELEFQSTAQILLFEQYTQFQVTLGWVGANVAGSSVPTPYSLSFTLKNCALSGKTPNVKDWGVIQQELDFMAFSTTVGALDEIQAVLTNDIQNYT